MDNSWKVWDDLPELGENFYSRSIDEKDEMESSKSVSKIISEFVSDEDKILDIGCGAGHYLSSLDKKITKKFSYHGVDATENYLRLAKKAYEGKVTEFRDVPTFELGDIYNLPMADKYADIVMCNNVLLHLPKIQKPMEELWRVSKKYLVIRTLVGDVSMRTKFVKEPEEFDDNGEPLNYNYQNIYSQKYIENIIAGLKDVKHFKIFQDLDFDQSKIGEHNFEDNYSSEHIDKKFITTILDGLQTSSYLLLPWCYIILEKD